MEIGITGLLKSFLGNSGCGKVLGAGLAAGFDLRQALNPDFSGYFSTLGSPLPVARANSSLARSKSFAIALFVALLYFVQSAPAFAVNSFCVSPSPLVFSSVGVTPTLTDNNTPTGCDAFSVGLRQNLNDNTLAGANPGDTFTTAASASTSGTTYRFMVQGFDASNNLLYTVSIASRAGTSTTDTVRVWIDPNGNGAADTALDVQVTLPTALPTVTSISPSADTTAGGTSVTITGTGFTGPASVTIGGTAATGVSVVSSTSITAITPAHVAGAASVLVTTPTGTNAANSLFTYIGQR